MNLYSNKQKWKIAFVLIALLVVGASLFYSNGLVNDLASREKERVKNWAFTVKKKLELVQLTNSSLNDLRLQEREKMRIWLDATKVLFQDVPLEIMVDYTFPLKLIEQNKEIPVIVYSNKELSSYKNLGFDIDTFQRRLPNLTKAEVSNLLEDSISKLFNLWSKEGRSFSEKVYPGLDLYCAYDESLELKRLAIKRDSLLHTFNQEVIHNVSLVPVILVKEGTDTIVGTNISEVRLQKKGAAQWLRELKQVNEPLSIRFDAKNRYLVYYDESPELKKIQFFPYIIFGMIGLFVLIGYLVFSTFRKAEQNQVWAGMAKETAHQLGTPLSSLMAWVHYLQTQNVDEMAVTEIQKDVDRLERVTDRFSKIGSGGKMEVADIRETISDVLNYLQGRISDKVRIEFEQTVPLLVKHNPSLMQWVVENICKNAVDAMEGNGKLSVRLVSEKKWLHIDIQDSGKGIHPKQINTIFKPGFSTKKRGWGLGLSLVKRIVSEYHKGKVFVLYTELDKGTTFRISIPI